MDFNVSQYLKKFAQFLPYETRVKNVVGNAIKEVVGIAPERSKIAVQGSKVFIVGPSSLKSEIALKQNKILIKIKEQEPKLNIEAVL